MSFSKTARMVAAIRAIETSKQSRPIINDPIISSLVSEADIARTRESLALSTATYKFIISRYRFIEEKINSLLHNNYRSVILLGSGLDTRAYRLSQGAFVEVDSPNTLEYKKELLKQSGINTNNVTYVGNDLAQSLSLTSPYLGFSIDNLKQPIVIVAEGLLYYLPHEALTGLLSITKSIVGTVLIFDYMDTSLLSSAPQQRFNERIQKEGEAIIALYDYKDIQSIISSSKLQLLEHIDTRDLIKKDFPDEKEDSSANHIVVIES